jgi:hypothetical protein
VPAATRQGPPKPEPPKQGRIQVIELTPEELAFVREDAINRMTDRLVDIWLHAHGAEILEQLAPGAISAALRERVTDTVFKLVGVNIQKG